MQASTTPEGPEKENRPEGRSMVLKTEFWFRFYRNPCQSNRFPATHMMPDAFFGFNHNFFIWMESIHCYRIYVAEGHSPLFTSIVEYYSDLVFL